MQVNLSWPAVTNALYYRVYRGTSHSGPYQLIGQSNPNPGQTSASANIVTSYQDGPYNLPNGIDFYYVVTAVTADGEGAYSNEYHATAPGQPSAISSLTGTVT